MPPPPVAAQAEPDMPPPQEVVIPDYTTNGAEPEVPPEPTLGDKPEVTVSVLGKKMSPVQAGLGVLVVVVIIAAVSSMGGGGGEPADGGDDTPVPSGPAPSTATGDESSVFGNRRPPPPPPAPLAPLAPRPPPPPPGVAASCSALKCSELAALYGGWPLDNSCADNDDVNICAESDAGFGQFSLVSQGRNTAGCSGNNCACHGGMNAAQGDDELIDGWDHAAGICEAIGARLCTVAELQADETRCTGCEHDAEQVWSADPCPQGHFTAQGGSHRGDEACPQECRTAECVCTPQCWTDSISHAVRCCADEQPCDASAIRTRECAALRCSDLTALYGGWPLDNECTATDDLNICAESDEGFGQFSRVDDSRNLACHGGQNTHQGDDETIDGWSHAASICQSMGARLCTVAELQADEARCTGCQHDGEQVWTSEPCDQGHFTAQGGSHRGAESCPEECTQCQGSFAGQPGCQYDPDNPNMIDQHGPGCLCRPQCWDDRISHAVRCCSEEGPPCHPPPPAPPANAVCSELDPPPSGSVTYSPPLQSAGGGGRLQLPGEHAPARAVGVALRCERQLGGGPGPPLLDQMVRDDRQRDRGPPNP